MVMMMMNDDLKSARMDRWSQKVTLIGSSDTCLSHLGGLSHDGSPRRLASFEKSQKIPNCDKTNDEFADSVSFNVSLHFSVTEVLK